MPRQFVALQRACTEQPQLPFWLCHLWQRIERRRFGLILGAGVTLDAGCPEWKELVGRLTREFPAASDAFTAHRTAGLQDTFITQIAYSLHKTSSRAPTTLPPHLERYQVDSAWMQIVHDQLYRDFGDQSFDDVENNHPYLKSLGRLVCRTDITVNFNFDDLVDEAAIRSALRRNQEQPEIVTNPKVFARPDSPVIYHINGFLPRDMRRHRSEKLIFTEDAFADVLISPSSGDLDFMVSRFATYTFLLLGTSLTDNSLKNKLRAGMKQSPANHHFIVCWEDSSAPRSTEERNHIFSANLEVYNLISVFLDTPQIAELIDMLNEEDMNIFESNLIQLSPHQTRKRYYLVGSVAAGKSSILEYLRCFTTFEEWSGRPPEKMYQDHKTLTPHDRKDIDNWLYSQIRTKNDKMRRAGVGVSVMDRAYLDLCAFSVSAQENLEKLTALREHVSINDGPLEAGQIIFLKADESILNERQARRGRLRSPATQIDYDGAALVGQSRVLENLYRPSVECTLDSSHEKREDTARQIARIMLLGSYITFDFEKRIDELLATAGVV